MTDNKQNALLGLIMIVLIFVVFGIASWLVMVLWGAIASQFGRRTISYGLAMLIVLALFVARGFFRR